MSWASLVKTVAGSVFPTDTDEYVPVRALPQKKTRFGFGRVYASGVDPEMGAILTPLGAGMTVNQSGGQLNITTGTSINQDTIIRSAFQVRDNYTLRWSTVLSQRIANNTFIVELVDVIGDGLATTINSATSVTVTIPNLAATLGWDARNVGQSVTLGNYVGTGTFVPGTMGVIASVSGNNVTFTVAGFAAGSGTCSLFGWNYHRITYDGTTATTWRYQTQRNGWPGTLNTLTQNTSATPGHIGILNVEDNIATLMEQLRASATTNQVTNRANAVQDMPGEDVILYVQLRAVNGTVAPASSTTWNLGFLDAEQYVPTQVSLTSTRPMSQQNAGPNVTIAGGSLSATIQAQNHTAYSLTTAATTNAAVVGAANTSRKLLEISISNPTATAAFVKIYHKGTAPTVGTDVPIMTIPVAAGAVEAFSFPPLGRQMASGIAIAVTGAAAATDTTATVAGIQIYATFQ